MPDRFPARKEGPSTGSATVRFPRPVRRAFALLLLLTFAALLVHGYHPGAEDGEIYVSSIVKILHPAYYPFDRLFFEANARLTLFPRLIAWSVRLSHLPLAWVLFLWHLSSIFLFLFACWKIAAKCFPTPWGRWGAVTLVAALLTMPIAQTDLYILDQYLNPRSLSAFAVLFAIDAILEKKYGWAALWLAFTALVHPQMAVFGVCYVVLLYLTARAWPIRAQLLPALLLIPGMVFRDPSRAYLQCLADHPDFFVLRWHWYGWLGAVAPLLLLVWFSRIARRGNRPVLERLAVSMALFGLLFLVAAIVVDIPEGLITLNRDQPMRSLYLVYLFLILFGGGFLGESVLKTRTLRWLLLFVPLCFGMVYVQFRLFPASRHVEWPGLAPKNPWTQAFHWIRGHTPASAIFALDPDFMAIPGEDHQGFRAIAERSRLADAVKDWSDSTLYPELPLADRCLEQVQAAKGWKHFTLADFERLRRTYGVSWVVLQQPGVPGLSCPYRNKAVLVCRLSPEPLGKSGGPPGDGGKR